MTCSKSHREFALLPALWTAKATLSTLRRDLSSNSSVCAEGWKEAMVKEVRVQGAGRKEARKGCRRRRQSSTISNRMVKLETSGHERYQMGLEWAAIRHWEIHWESRQPEEAESKGLICKQHRALHTEAAAATQGQHLDLRGVDRTFGQHQSPRPVL